MLCYLCTLYLCIKKRETKKEKKSFFQSIAQPQLLRTSMRRPTFGIQVKQASTASLDGANKKKGPKNSLVSPCREGTRKYGYFHMLRLPSKSLVESLRLSHKIGLKAIKRRRRGPTLHTTFFTYPNIYAVRYSFLKLHFGSLYHFHYSSVDSSFLKQCFFKKLFLRFSSSSS